MVLASMMGEAMIFVVDSDEAVGQCDDEDMRKLEALAANKKTTDSKSEKTAVEVSVKPTQSQEKAQGKPKRSSTACDL